MRGVKIDFETRLIPLAGGDAVTLASLMRDKKAMILFSRKNAELMRRHEKELPFKRDSLVIWLDPWFPEADAAWLQEEIEYWIGKDQRAWVANNPAHLGMLRGRGLTVVAGPWLYAFNRWSAAFLLEEGAAFLVPPLEISKQDFQKVSEVVPSASWMPVVFAYPALFRMRGDLSERYDFRFFTDREGSSYELAADRDQSVVIPSKPFSIVDRIPFLKKEGISKFILDFSHVEFTKPLYKTVMKAAEEGRVLPETSRFNWKEGFWQAEEGGPRD